LGIRNECGSRETDPIRDTLDHGSVADVQTVDPYRPKER
jgi:hypothetical protein